MAEDAKGFTKPVEIDSKLPDSQSQEEQTEHGTVAIAVETDANGNTVITREDGESYTIDKKAERKLLWKFDLRILPLLTMMYLFNALDKANMGNAATVSPADELILSSGTAADCRQAGLLEDLGMEDNNKYNILLSVRLPSKPMFRWALCLSWLNALIDITKFAETMSLDLLHSLRPHSTICCCSRKNLRPFSSPTADDVHLRLHDASYDCGNELGRSCGSSLVSRCKFVG